MTIGDVLAVIAGGIGFCVSFRGLLMSCVLLFRQKAERVMSRCSGGSSSCPSSVVHTFGVGLRSLRAPRREEPVLFAPSMETVG